MANSMNKAILLGTIGKDAEMKYLPNGNPVSRFSLATNRSYKKGDEWVKETDWHNIVLWGSEGLVQYLVKGAKVMIEGRISNRSYEDKNGNKAYTSEIVADNIVLCGSKPTGESGGYQQQYRGSSENEPFNGGTQFDGGDDVPF